MDELTANGARLAVGIAIGLLPGAEIGNLGAGRILGVALGVSPEIAGRRSRERDAR